MLWQKQPLAKNLFEFSIGHSLLWRYSCHTCWVNWVPGVGLEWVTETNKPKPWWLKEWRHFLLMLHSLYKLAGILFRLITVLSGVRRQEEQPSSATLLVFWQVLHQQLKLLGGGEHVLLPCTTQWPELVMWPYPTTGSWVSPLLAGARKTREPVHLWSVSKTIASMASFTSSWIPKFRLQCVLSCFSCVWPFVTPWTASHQVPLSMGFSRQEYWSGLSFPAPGALPHQGTEPASLMSAALAGSLFTISTTWEAPLDKLKYWEWYCWWE